MNTLGSAIKLRFLDLAGLETYISQIILLIKLITTTSGVKNKTIYFPKKIYFPLEKNLIFEKNLKARFIGYFFYFLKKCIFKR